MRIAIIGAQGQLGGALVRECAKHHEVVPLGRSNLDITDEHAVASMMPRLRVDVLVNCAAFNDVDGAEDRPVDALNVNAFGVRSLARAAADRNMTLVHFSTDFVFDGTATEPYPEDARPNPKSVYATSKLLGEWFALDAPQSYVLRVESLFGRVAGARVKGTVAALVNAMREGRDVKVFEDRVVSPTYVIDAARVTRELIERSPTYGIYHCVNSGSCTWLAFAQELGRRMGIEPKLVPMRLEDAKLRAQRPLYCALSNKRLASLGITMPAWEDAVGRYLGSEAIPGLVS